MIFAASPPFSIYHHIYSRHPGDAVAHAGLSGGSDNHGTIEAHLWGMNAVGYSSVSALTFLLYDILITLDDEVRLIWPNPRNQTKLLFFFIRYFPIMLQTTIMFLGTPPFTFTNHECYIWNVYQAIASLLIVACVDYILILRVFALYPRNRVVQLLLLGSFVLEIIIISVMMGLAVPGMITDATCTVLDVPFTFLVAAGAPIVFQTLLFGLTGFKFVQAVKSGWGHVPIMKLLMRDGTWAFILLFFVLISEAALYGFATEAYSGILYGWLNTFYSFCGYRILLNLNHLNHVSSNRPSRQTRSATTAGIEFTTNFDCEPNQSRWTDDYAMDQVTFDHSVTTGSQFRSRD